MVSDNRCQKERVNSMMESEGAGGKCHCTRDEDYEERYLTRPNSNASNRSTSPLNVRADDSPLPVGSQPPTSRAAAQRSRQVSNTGNKSTTKLLGAANNDSIDEELVHVLVSRPTVASRPRDNIVFEGDMDLKTTFETSYEALAKMRLDCWKRYQENRSSTPRGEMVDNTIGATADVESECDRKQFDKDREQRKQVSHGSSKVYSKSKSSTSGGGGVNNNFKNKNNDSNNGGRHVTNDYYDFDGAEHEMRSSNIDRDEAQIDDVSVDYYNKPAAFISHSLATDRRKRGGEVEMVDGIFSEEQSKLIAGSSKISNQQSEFENRTTDMATPLGPPVRQHAAGLQSSSGQSEVRNNCSSSRTRSVEAQVVDEDLPPVQFDDDTQRSLKRGATSKSPVDLASLPPAGTPSNRTTPVNEAAGYVDPDLAPIMVYDSNMNRLEKVGLRRRSKYRPSTSLRPGARGLFGDQPEVIEDANSKQVVAEKIGSQRQTNMSPVNISTKDQRQVQHAAGASPVNRFPEDEMDVFNQKLNRKTRQALDARNLGDSHQPKYLTFSQQNLPIDSKRRVVDNINMIDNIKEYNIVAGSHQHRDVSTSIDAGSPVAISYMSKQQQHHKSHDNHSRGAGEESRHCAMSSGENVNVYEREDDLAALDEINKMAELEEAEAVAEIQRVTMPKNYPSSPSSSFVRNERLSQQGDNLSSMKHQTREPVGAVSTSKDVRQEKLHKTCQQQNFHIFENDYPEAREKQKTVSLTRSNTLNSTNSIATSSPPTRTSYKNLFRESPDFIMTTGKFNEKESSQIETADSKNQRRYHQITESVEEQVPHSGGSQRYSKTPCDECQVLKLRDEFDFVEAKSGHKYFAPKTPSPVHFKSGLSQDRK